MIIVVPSMFKRMIGESTGYIVSPREIDVLKTMTAKAYRARVTTGRTESIDALEERQGHSQ